MGPEIERNEDSIQPPRWADALLRSFLKYDEIETVSGDLLEVYRDSIRPQRGRWRADLWYVRQVAGYAMGMPSTMNLRNWILAGLTLCALTIAFSVLKYPESPFSFPVLAVISFGLLFYACVAVWRTRPVTPEHALVLRLGAKWGLALGTLWIAAYKNFRLPFGWLLVLAAFALPFIGGAHGVIKTGRMRNGMRVGFWSGLISGLMVFLVLAVSGYIGAFSGTGDEIPRTPFYIAAEYQRVNIFDALGAGLVHLFGFGGLLGTVQGTIGGLLVRTGLSPEEKSRLQ
jgi:hypothetical protein